MLTVDTSLCDEIANEADIPLLSFSCIFFCFFIDGVLCLWAEKSLKDFEFGEKKRIEFLYFLSYKFNKQLSNCFSKSS
jgi:hypothetical protein